MNEPRFSIVVPVYNTEKELERCVRSVTCQSCRSFELILVDDGSRDRSGALCDAFSAEDDRIVAIHQQNAGSSAARNTGIQAARGKYLLFLDSDDLWDDASALEKLSNLIDDHPADVICFGVRIYDDDGTFVKERLPKPYEWADTSKEAVLRQLVYSNQYFSASYVKAIRREFFVQGDLFFTKGLISGEDGEWSGKVMLRANSIAVLPEAFYKRIRRESGGITSSIGVRNIQDVFRAIKAGTELVEEKAESETLKKLYLEYWAYQYAMLFGLSYRLHKDSAYGEIIQNYQKFRWLLRYDHVKKVRAVRVLVTLFGIRGAIFLLSKIYQHKR